MLTLQEYCQRVLSSLYAWAPFANATCIDSQTKLSPTHLDSKDQANYLKMEQRFSQSLPWTNEQERLFENDFRNWQSNVSYRHDNNFFEYLKCKSIHNVVGTIKVGVCRMLLRFCIWELLMLDCPYWIELLYSRDLDDMDQAFIVLNRQPHSDINQYRSWSTAIILDPWLNFYGTPTVAKSNWEIYKKYSTWKNTDCPQGFNQFFDSAALPIDFKARQREFE
jgi:hypothetical protein